MINLHHEVAHPHARDLTASLPAKAQNAVARIPESLSAVLEPETQTLVRKMSTKKRALAEIAAAVAEHAVAGEEAREETETETETEAACMQEFLNE